MKKATVISLFVLVFVAFWSCYPDPKPINWIFGPGVPQGDGGAPGGDGDTDVDADGDTDADADADGDADGGIIEETFWPEDAGAPGSRMVGTWGMLLHVATLQTGIPIISTQAAASRSWFLVDLTSDGAGNYTASETLCGIKLLLATHPANKSVVPEAFIENMPALIRKISCANELPNASWISDEVYDVRGAKLADPINDPLPPNKSGTANDATTCEAAAVGSFCDQDLDAHPGVTLFLRGVLNCATYSTQRWSSKFDGKIVDWNRISGSISASAYQTTVLASNVQTCTLGNPGTAPIIESCPNMFYFKMVRLDEGATCEDVLSKTNCYASEQQETKCAGDKTMPLNPDVDTLSKCVPQ